MNDNDNNQDKKPQPPSSIFFNKYVAIALVVAVAGLGAIGLIASIWDAAGNVVNNAIETAKETIKDVADTAKLAANHVATHGWQGVKDIAGGRLKYAVIDPYYPMIKQAARI